MEHSVVIEVKDRKILTPTELKQLGVVGDNSTEIRIFKVDRYYDAGDGVTKIDLFEYEPYICVATSTQHYDKLPLTEEDGDVEKNEEDNCIYLRWDIKRKHVFSKDRIYVKLQFEQTYTDINLDGDAYEDKRTWQTYVTFFEVSPTIYVDEEIANLNPTILQDFDSRLDRLENYPPSADGLYWGEH